MVTDQGGELRAAGKWDKRRLAYEISGRREGIYILMYFNGEPAVAAELDRLFRITDEVFRHIIVRVEPEHIDTSRIDHPQPSAAPVAEVPAEAVETPADEAAAEEPSVEPAEELTEEPSVEPAEEAVEEPAEETVAEEAEAPAEPEPVEEAVSEEPAVEEAPQETEAEEPKVEPEKEQE